MFIINTIFFIRKFKQSKIKILDHLRLNLGLESHPIGLRLYIEKST